MNQLMERIAEIKSAMESESVNDAASLEAFRIKYLGTKGLVKAVMGEMKNVPNDQKKEAGLLLNELKIFADSHFEKIGEGLGNDSGSSSDLQDLSLPGENLPLGTRHPISLIQQKIIRIFEKIGFSVAEGPEVEDDWHNFSALNLPEDHPARDMQDTFYISKNPDWLLRTHTSSVQIREMQKGKLPLRIICPGRVYRNETISARAHC
ncbi:MAG: phenylalanine--tRNA ligase subunit alpha, partial [Pseudanabaena sp.]